VELQGREDRERGNRHGRGQRRPSGQGAAAGRKGQQVDLWLAPSLDWYPVRVRFNDPDGDFVDQTLEKVVKK
jgi:hypothetical protein